MHAAMASRCGWLAQQLWAGHANELKGMALLHDTTAPDKQRGGAMLLPPHPPIHRHTVQRLPGCRLTTGTQPYMLLLRPAAPTPQRPPVPGDQLSSP